MPLRQVRNAFAASMPDELADAEMHGDVALGESAREPLKIESELYGSANVLVPPNLDAANILTPSSTVRRIVNMTALTVAQATKAAAP